MNFLSPWFLILLPLAVLPWFRNREHIAFSSLRLLRVRSSWRARCSWLPELFASLAIVAAILVLARPGEQTAEEVVERPGLDIMLVVDTSGSMKVTDYRRDGKDLSRIDAAKLVMSAFAERRRHDNVGMTVFGEEAFTFIPLTLDEQGAVQFIQQIQVGMAGAQGTAVGDGIAIAAQRLKQRDSKSGVMILLTDGESNVGIDPLRAANAASALGFRIYTIGIGAPLRATFTRRRAGLDEATLREIAERTGGRYFRGQTLVGLESIYNEIDTIEPTSAVVREQVRRREEFRPWAVSAVLCLLLHLLLSETWFRRLP